MFHIRSVGDIDSFASKIFTQTNETVLNNLKPGIYSWMISVIDRNSVILTDTSINYITIMKRIMPPVILTPVNKSIVNIIKEDKIIIKWKKSQGAGHYKITLFRDGYEKLLENETDELQYIINDISGYGKGTYLINLQAVQTDAANSKIIQTSRAAERELSFTRKMLEKPTIEKLEIK